MSPSPVPHDLPPDLARPRGQRIMLVVQLAVGALGLVVAAALVALWILTVG